MSEQELAGKVAIVTGAGRNIGRAIALKLASIRRRGRRQCALERGGGGRASCARSRPPAARPSACSAMSPIRRSRRRWLRAALAQFGRIDILVNNAAVRREKPITEMSYADWREVMDVTLDSAFHCVKACLPALRKNGGAIVNIGGMSAHIGSKHRAHVMTAKAGLVGFTRGLAHDLAADRIAVNCVVPGAIDTPRPQTVPKPAHHLTHGTITGERGTSEDVAALVHFLCTPAAHFVTGQAIHANGGAYLGSLMSSPGAALSADARDARADPR